MIIQTSRANGFSPVLRGEIVNVGPLSDGHVQLRCRGAKRVTGEAYEFRVLVSDAEFQLLVRAAAKQSIASRRRAE